MPTMQVEAMGRLEAILGRSAPETLNETSGLAAEEPVLWLDQESRRPKNVIPHNALFAPATRTQTPRRSD